LASSALQMALSPNYLETLIGKKAAKDMLQDEAFYF
jgi:hypothetical protein